MASSAWTRLEDELVGDAVHALAQRALRARGAPARRPRRWPGGPGTRAAGRRAPAGQQRGRDGDPADVRRRHRVAELQPAQRGQAGEPQRAREGDERRAPLQRARRPPTTAAGAMRQLGAGHRAVEPVGQLRLVRRPRPARSSARPRVGQAAGRRQRDVPDGRVELPALDGRGRRQRRAARDLLGARRAGRPGRPRPARSPPSARCSAPSRSPSPRRRSGSGPQAADPARRRPAGGERAAPAVGAVDRRDDGRDAGALPERGQQPGAVLARRPGRRGRDRRRRRRRAARAAAPTSAAEPGQRRLAPRDAVGELVAQRVEALARSGPRPAAPARRRARPGAGAARGRRGRRPRRPS